MKLLCIKDNLWKSLSIVSKAINQKATLPILSNVLIVTDQGQLKIIGTDLELAFISWLGAKIDEKGEIAIPAKLFFEYVSSLKDEKINLQTTDTHLKIKTENNTSNIKIFNASEYPSIPQIEEGLSFTIKTEQLKEGLEDVFFAATNDETRPVLNGVFLKVFEDKIHLVATDSYRLARTEIAAKAKMEKEIIIPNRTVSELIRVLPFFPKKEVDVYIHNNQVALKIEGELEVISRLIEGNFPAYEQIIPNNFQSTVLVNRNDFLNAIKLTNLFAKENANNVKVEILPKDKNLRFSATSSYLGDTSTTLEAKIEGDQLDIAFNARYLPDVLTTLSSEDIQLNFSGKLSPAVLTLPGDGQYHYVIMPLRI